MYGTTFTVGDLGAGEHTVEAVIANADSLTDARDEVTVTVGDGALPATTTLMARDDSGGYDY